MINVSQFYHKLVCTMAHGAPRAQGLNGHKNAEAETSLQRIDMMDAIFGSNIWIQVHTTPIQCMCLSEGQVKRLFIQSDLMDLIFGCNQSDDSSRDPICWICLFVNHQGVPNLKRTKILGFIQWRGRERSFFPECLNFRELQDDQETKMAALKLALPAVQFSSITVFYMVMHN